MDAKTFYEQIAPKLDPGGFKLYFTAKRMTGFDLYGQFPYKQAGNSVTVTVIEAIGRRIRAVDEELRKMGDAA